MDYTIADMYLDFVNNFVTVSAFADYYGISDLLAARIIAEGSALQERRIGK